MFEDPSSLRLRAVHELLGEAFFVPAYQRGYRWSPSQVRALLDDLDAFLANDPPPHSYYCLQPVVVRGREDGRWELVDGQQRLTTICLILGSWARWRGEPGAAPLLLAYETREGSAQYMASPDAARASSNVDFHHMYEASEAALGWLRDHPEPARRDEVVASLMREDGRGANVRVIWYELSERQDPREVFIRLNVGRIPLTSAELIRALFLRREDDERQEAHEQRLRLAHEWGTIERRLHEPERWLFLQSDDEDASPPVRIGYLFDIFARLHEPAIAAQPDQLASFFAIQRWLSRQRRGRHDSWVVFRRQLVQVLDEWFEDHTLYHLVGALIAVTPGGSEAYAQLIVELLQARGERSASAFDGHLRLLMWRRFLGQPGVAPPADQGALEQALDERLDALQYGQQRARPLRIALLLFNVAGVLANRAPTQRFRFDGFKQQVWDIEHVRSSAEHIPRSPARRRVWLEHARDFVRSPIAQARDADEAATLLAEIDAQLRAKAPDRASFEASFEAVRAMSGEGEARAADHALSNLVLLDMGTNRSYQNAIFPIKRGRIIDLDRRGVYVPPGTRNVFLKYYTSQAAQLLLWDEADQAAYGHAQREALLSLFAPMVERSP